MHLNTQRQIVAASDALDEWNNQKNTRDEIGTVMVR